MTPESMSLGVFGKGGVLRNACLLFAFAAAVARVDAAEIAFTGAGGDADLAAAANWEGGELPGADDVAVVDVSASGSSYALSSPLAIGGLRFTNNAKGVEIVSENALAIGADGIVCDGTNGTSFKLPLRVAAAQTWDFGGAPARFHRTFAGTESLTIKNAKGVWHYWSPRYGGTITYSGIKEWNQSDWSRPTHVNFYEPDCKWADRIVLSSWCQVRLLFNGPVSFQQLFPGMDPLSVGQGFGIECMKKDEGAAGGLGSPTLTVGAGEAVKMWQFCLGGGDLVQTDGSFTVQDEFWIGNNWYYNYTYDAPCHYHLSGGTFDAKIVNIGEYGNGVTRLVQSGGAVTVSTIVMGGGNQTKEDALAEWRQDGGTVTVTSAYAPENNNGTLLYYPQGQWGDGRAMYELRGGTHSTPRVLFGTNFDRTPDTVTDSRNNGGSHMPCHNSYGLFELSGGTLELGAGGIATGWNWNPDGWTAMATNCYADMRLCGGTLKTGTSATTAPLRIPRSGRDVEWNVALDAAHAVFAPVIGDGSLVKTGAGTLSLTDATAFNGSVDVREGTLRLLGKGAAAGEASAASGATGHDFWQWTGDAAQASGATNGASVDAWVDLQYGVAATNANVHFINNGKEKDEHLACPTLVTNAFNGHAALKFENAMLTVQADANPFVGADEMTIVLAFKMTKDGTSALARGRYYDQGTHILNPGNGDYNEYWGPWFRWCAGSRLNFMVDSGEDDNTTTNHIVVSREGVSLKGDVHVAVATVSEAGGLTLMVDGAVTNRAWVGTYRPLFCSKWNRAKAMPLMIGCLVSDTWNIRSITGLHVGEMRFYTNALPRAVMADISAELYAKYNGAVAGLAGVVSDCDGAVAGELVAPPAAEIPEGIPAPTQRWTADSLAATHADGADVESWPAVDGTRALAVESGCAAPAFVASSANGHAAVRFDAARKTTLGAKATDALARNDWNNWTMAVVFRSTERATGLTGVMEGHGIVSVMKGETSANCFQFAMVTNGEMRVYSSTARILRRRPLHLDDGNVHVAVFTSDMVGRYCGKQDCILVVDGVVNDVRTGPNPELANGDAFRLRLGQLVNGKGLFSGEIMEVRWYSNVNAPLTMEQTIGVCAELAETYGVPLYPRGNFGPGKVAGYGLGATNVSVAAGAALALPLAETSPFTVGAGQTLSLDGGSVAGPLVLADGGTLRLAFGQMAEIESLKAVGAVRLDVAGLPESRRSFTPLANVAAADVAGAAWKVVGKGGCSVEVRDGVLGVVSRNGTLLVFR